NVVKDYFVVKHGGCLLVLAGQERRSYLKSRAMPHSYEGMVKILMTSVNALISSRYRQVLCA
ncbi:MAG: hypothetical protein WAU54_14175, partial [Chania sp.]